MIRGSRSCWQSVFLVLACLFAVAGCGGRGDPGSFDLCGLDLAAVSRDDSISMECRLAATQELPQLEHTLDEKIVVLGSSETPDKGWDIYVHGTTPKGTPLTSDDLAELAVEAFDRDGRPMAEVPEIGFGGFELPAPVFSVSLLMDWSASMRPADLDRSRRFMGALAASIPLAEVEILAFSNKATTVRAFTEDRASLAAGVALTPSLTRDRTALYDAVGEGITHLSRRAAPLRLLIVLTDGLDNASTRYDLGDILSMALEHRVLVVPIAVFLADAGVARRLAGTLAPFFYAPDLDQLTDPLDRFTDSLAEAARVSIPNPPADLGSIGFSRGGVTQKIPRP